MRWMSFVACCVAAGVANAAGIYRCVGADGEALFTDVACPAGHPQTTPPINSVDLALPDVALPARGGAGATRREQAAHPSNDRASDGAARRCAAARDRLDAVRATMRHGYKASSAGRMQTRLRDARARVERDCAR